MITIKMTDSENLLTQIQEFQVNYTRILANSHSTFSEDLVMFTFCSTLPLSYEETACQYLDNIDDITKYKLSDIIARVLQEENLLKGQLYCWRLFPQQVLHSEELKPKMCKMWEN